MKSFGTYRAALLAAALLAAVFTGTASATTVTDSGGGTTPTIHVIHENSHMEMHNAIVNIKCNMTASGVVQGHGSGVTAGVALTSLSFNNCTDEWVFDVVAPGLLEIHYKEVGSGGHGVGTVTWTGATFTSTRAGLSCNYRTNETTIGTLTGGTPATLKIEASIPRHGGSFLCGGSTAQWTGALVTTETLKIDP